MAKLHTECFKKAVLNEDLVHILETTLSAGCSSYPWQFSDEVGVEQQLLEGAGVAQNLIRYGSQVAVAPVDVIHGAIACIPERNATKHRCTETKLLTREVLHYPVSGILDPVSDTHFMFLTLFYFFTSDSRHLIFRLTKSVRRF